MPSILFWDAVQFVTVKNPRDKKKPVSSAFEPLDNDHSRNKVNLFVPLDKKHLFLLDQRHPAIFTCVLRRTAGVKAMDVHAFVCGSEDEAIAIVHSLNNSQEAYKSGEVSETGVFGYRPFQGGLGRSQSVKSLHNLGLSSPVNSIPIEIGASNSAERTQKPSRSPFPVPAQMPPHSLAAHSATPPRSMAKNGGHHDHHVFQLTQADFSPAPDKPPRGTPSRDSAQSARVDPRSTRTKSGHSTPSPDYESSAPASSPASTPAPDLPIKHLRDRLQHVDSVDTGQPLPGNRPTSLFESRSVSASGGEGDGVRTSATDEECRTSPVSGEGVRLSVAQRTRQFLQDSTPNKSAPKYKGKSQSVHIRGFQDRLAASESKHRDASDSGLPPHYRNAAERTVQKPTQEQEAPSLPPRRSESTRVPAQSGYKQRATSQYDVRNVGVDEASPRPPPASRVPFESRSRITELPVRRQDGQTSPTQDFRPVAKVPPHKVSGIKVLPTAPVLPVKAKHNLQEVNSSSSGDSENMGSSKHFTGVTPRRSKSQYFSDKQSSPKGNWQFKASAGSDKAATPSQQSRTGGKNTSGDKLLLGQKKEAEIASVLHDMRFNYDDRTMSPGMPAGNNFEKSLGYFP